MSWMHNKYELYTFEEFDGSLPNQIEVFTKDELISIITKIDKDENIESKDWKTRLLKELRIKIIKRK
jgi:hypothetical protein